MISCYDVARYFLKRCDRDAGDLMSNLKLQKLVYYAQGLYLALYDEPLFAETMEAWPHGPVIPELYDSYKSYGAGAIPAPETLDFSVFDDRIHHHLEQVYSCFGRFSALELREMTHNEAPWKNAPNKGIIESDRLKNYFQEWLKNNPDKIKVISPSQKQSIVKEFEALASQWYDETGGYSFIVEKTSHPAYQKIIDMGQPVVHLLLRELERNPAHWFKALRTITGANPVEPEQRGRMRQMAASWLKWGREHGYK